jgi:hypothetical protein
MIENLALKSFASQFGDEILLAQVLIRRSGSGYELRHIGDRDVPAEKLRAVDPAGARSLAQFTASGEFRPLKAAPNLAKGRRISAANDADLELALNGLYPGALADWHAVQAPNPPLTDYHAFAWRQSGMYRIIAKLTDAQAATVILQGCAAANCLKRRLWTAAGLEPDQAAQKSIIPCLEPCAVLLELARKAARAGQEVACTNADID